MPPPEHLLSITSTSEGDAVTIHADREGLQLLRERIDALLGKLEHGGSDHDHLRSEDWAGFELTTSMLASESAAGHHSVHHVKIYAWSADWKTRHRL